MCITAWYLPAERHASSSQQSSWPAGSGAGGAEVRTRLFICITTADQLFIPQQNTGHPSPPHSRPSLLSSRSHSATSGSRSDIGSADLRLRNSDQSPAGISRGQGQRWQLRRSLADALQSVEHLHLAVCGVIFRGDGRQCSIAEYMADEKTFQYHASCRCLFYILNEVLSNAVFCTVTV